MTSTPDSHYFDDDPTVASDPGQVEVLLPHCKLDLVTDRGVFSRDRLDPGTRLLLHSAPEPPADAAELLDLGCGYGPVACALGRLRPSARVWAVDVNSRARNLCAANAEANAASNVVVAAPNEVPDDITFDAIWSNPPIRIGKVALHEMLLTWLGRLSATGSATLVVQRHLGADSLQRWLASVGHPTERLASRSAYRILKVSPHDGETERH